MTDRLEVERLLRELYDARVRGSLDDVCRVFSDDAIFQIAGAGHVSPIVSRSVGVAQFRPLLNLMIRTFKLSDFAILVMIIDGMRAAVQWEAWVYSRISGTSVFTQLVDLVEIRNARIIAYTEFLVPGSLST